MKILFLAANPPGTSTLDLGKEVSTIEDGLQRSKLRDQFQLVSKWAVDSNSLRRALLEENPDIVHFSAHGEGQAGLGACQGKQVDALIPQPLLPKGEGEQDSKSLSHRERDGRVRADKGDMLPAGLVLVGQDGKPKPATAEALNRCAVYSPDRGTRKIFVASMRGNWYELTNSQSLKI